MDSIYSIALAQNTITTGLIAYRIWRQDRASHEAGLRSAGSNSTSSLIPIVRIVVESAVIYVLTAIVIIILYARNNNFQFVIQEAIVPIIGMFSLLQHFCLFMYLSRNCFHADFRATRHAYLQNIGDHNGWRQSTDRVASRPEHKQ